MNTTPRFVWVIMIAGTAALSLAALPASAQEVTDEPLPGNAFHMVKADLISGLYGNIHILTLSDTTTPGRFGSESGFQSLLYFQRGPSGFTTPRAIPDSALH